VIEKLIRSGKINGFVFNETWFDAEKEFHH